MSGSVRVDKWVWAIRLYKTRAEATDACRGGHVKVNGASAKPATPVKVGDRVEARVRDARRVVEAVELIDKRVGAVAAAASFVDHSPPPPDTEPTGAPSRDRGSGRPTKRERRQLDRWRGT